MSIYICTICNNQKDSDFNCAELDGKECCEECFDDSLATAGTYTININGVAVTVLSAVKPSQIEAAHENIND